MLDSTHVYEIYTLRVIPDPINAYVFVKNTLVMAGS